MARTVRSLLVSVATASAVVSTVSVVPVILPAPPALAAPASAGAPAASPAVRLTPPAAARLGQASAALPSTAAAAPARPERVRELGWKRTASSKTFLMSDGSAQIELSSTPVHFRDERGTWRDVDTKVSRGSGAVAFENDRSGFRSRFGKTTDKLVRFELDGTAIGLGAVGDARPVTPVAEGSTVRFPDVFGTADVRYTVSATGLKEDIVLEAPSDVAESYAFELTTGGLTARSLDDGSIGFFRRSGDSTPRFVMPAPFMYDGSARGAADKGWSHAVNQKVTQQGGRSILTLTPDQDWLRASGRTFPVVIDPTITIVPAPDAAQDAAIQNAAPTTAYPSNATIPVGRASSTTTWRGLFKFDVSPLAGVDVNTIRSADLNLHFASPFASEANAVPIQAHEVTKPWTEATATWTGMSTSFTAGLPYTQVLVDDTEAGLTSFIGPWKDSSNVNAEKGSLSYLPLGTATNEYFYWNARLPGPGNYKVDARYVPYSNRGTVTYTVSGDVAPATAKNVNQTTGAATGQWVELTPSQHFRPGATTQVRLNRVTSTTATSPVADAVRWIEYARQTKEKDQHDAWHSFATTTLVKKWVSTPSSNNGVMLKTTDEAAGPLGGPYYEASENLFNGATENRPKLVITYDEPGVNLNVPTTIHASGPELTWSKYVDPTPNLEDDLVEYQVFRGCTTLPETAPGVNGCASPVGEHFTGTPATSLTLVGTVANDVTSFTDESALASTPVQAATYNYWVVARTVADTQNGKNGRAASNVQTVTTPREGRIARVLTGDMADTTLSAKLPTTNLPRPDSTTATTNNRYWLQVGNAHATYGDERAVLEFDTSRIKEDVKVTAARLELFQAGGAGTGAGTFDVHALRKDFDEGTSTWNQANATTPWVGGDFDPTLLASIAGVGSSTKRLTFEGAALASRVQAWVDAPGDNHGFLLKTRDEAATQNYLNIVSSEATDDINFRPRLHVEHLVKNAAETYEANEMPERFVPGTIIETPVTVTNTTNGTWPAGLELSYRWTEPGSTTDLTVSGERNEVALGRALAPGESVLLTLPIRTPINSDTGAKRLAYDLYLDLLDGDQWFSSTNPPAAPVARPAQGCVIGDKGLLCVDRYVESPTSTQLGLEKFLSYTGEETGGGAQLLANLYAGNMVWSYDAMSNPSIGPRAFVRVAYNSMDVTDDGAGYGMSVQPGTLTRLGSRLSVPSGGSTSNLMTFVDGDGTTHTYKLNDTLSTSSKLVYVRPAGVALELTRDLTAPTALQWVFTRPEGTRFYYSQATGLPTSVVDRNGNATTFTHDADGRLTTVRDTSGRATLTLAYDDAGLLWIRDVSGRALKFGYNDTHQLVTLQDGGPFNATTGAFETGAVVKTFGLGYTDTSVNGNAKLNKITDPRLASTDITYWTSTENSAYALWPKQYTDRRGNATTFAYSDPDASAAKDLLAEVTDVNGSTPSTTTYRMDGYGRTTSITDANANAVESAEATNLGWDTDHNVIRLEEPNGAVSTWRYDARTGYPLEVRDALSVKNNTPGMKLVYETLAAAPGSPTVLKSKTSAQGRTDTFTYDAKGNLASVRNGLGFGPTYTYNANGTLATVTDARNGLVKYGTYEENGYPLSITDPLGAVTEFVYDVRGNVIQTKDALARITTAEYDALGRPRATTTPYDGAVKRTTTTDYDLNDNVVKETAPNGAVTSFEFDAADNVTVKHLPDNGNGADRRITYVYDALGRVLQETAPKGTATMVDLDDFVTRYTYDRVGQVLKVATPFVDADGVAQQPTTTYGYDSVGNQILEIDPKKTASGGTDYTTKWTYDLNHQVTAITDAAGHTSRNEYDRDGLLVAEIDQLGNKKTTVYDAAAQPTEVRVPHTPIGGTTETRVTKTVYDQLGNVVKEILPSGKFSETVYDLANQPIQKKSPFTTGDANYATPASTFIEYDAVGQTKRQSEPTFATVKPAADNQWTWFTYYESGDVKTSKDPWSITTSYDYDAIGNQTKRTLSALGDDATRSKAWSYYPDGSLKTLSDTAAQQPVDVVDNVDTWQATATGTWATVTGGVNTQGTNYRTHAAAAAGTAGASETFTWNVTPDVGGTFDVLVSCPVRTDSTTAANYTVNHSTGATVATVNQRTCTSAEPWKKLGTFTFSGGSTKTIVLKPSTSGLVIADALRLVAKDAVRTRAFEHKYDLNGAETEIRDIAATAAAEQGTVPEVSTIADTFTTTYDGLGRATRAQELKAGTAVRQTDFSYDLNSNPASAYAQQFAVNGLTAASRYTGLTFDLRNMPDTVKSGPTPTGTVDTWQFTYDARGMRTTMTKPNGNVQTSTYHEDGKVRTLVERLSKVNGDGVVASHSLKYWPDGTLKEDNAKVDQGNHATNTVDQVSVYDYTPSQKLAKVTKTGITGEKGDNETYLYDAAGNIKTQTIGAATSTMTYDRNRLVKTVAGTTTLNHRYDPLGRATTVDVGARVVERYSYDGFDRMVRHQKWSATGVHEVTKSIGYDVFDRTSTQAVRVTTQPTVSTRFVYLGQQDQIAVEEQTNTAGAYEVSKVYSYLPGGEKIALVDTPVNGTTTKKLYYGTNPRGDVETMTDSTGKVTSTYRYTAYGSPDKAGTTGDDAITGDPVKDADVVNPYRFNGKRFDGATGTYDMGFRDYNPGLNRFLSRDMYDGALDDMALGTDPWNTNRYAFAGGNPINRVELDGHWGVPSFSDIKDTVSDAVDDVSDAVSDVADEVSEAATAVGDFVVEHKATIAGIATGIVVYAGCTGATIGGGAVACAAVAGAAGSAVQNAMDENGDHSVGGFAKSMVGGAAVNVVTLGAGKALAPVLSKVAAPLKSAVGNASGRLSASMRTAVSKFSKGCSSFSGSTVVLMADGSEKPIEQVAVGDMVLATDPETGEQVAKEVTAVWVHDDTLLDLLVDGEAITTTEDHPFWNLTDGEFQFAEEIDPGDQVLTSEGRAVIVRGLVPSTAYTALAYNLTVEGIHTYHVGESHVLVHNTSACSRNAVILAQNLQASGVRRPADMAAHHIVASGHKAAAPARKHLQSLGMDINDPANGVYLPRFAKSPNPSGSSVHAKIHTKEYFKYTNDMVLGARNVAEVTDVLNFISKQLLGGLW